MNTEIVPPEAARPEDETLVRSKDVDSVAAAAAETANEVATDAALAAPPESADEPVASLALHVRTRTLLAFLLLLAVLYTGFLARDLIVPVLLAVFFGLCGNPVVARLNKMWIPRWVGAFAVVGSGLAALVLGATLLLPPAAQWLKQAPSELRQHVPKLRELTKPFEEASKATASLQRMTETGPPAAQPVQVVEPPKRNLVTLLADAPRTLASVLAVLILSFFFMVYGEDLLRRLVMVVPGWRQKRITVDILRSIQTDISRYMLTVTAINLGLGAATAGALMWIGLAWPDALFWGAVAGALNYAPYLGPLCTAIALLLVGMVEFDTLGQALLPPAAFLLLHLVESQFVTPWILGRRMAISPVILLLWLFLWGWMWGIAGLLLAVPMLVCFKIVCDRIESLKVWGSIMEP